MTWGIIAALPAELELIIGAMRTERTHEAFGVRYHIGKIGGARVAAACCGVGTINAAACAAVLVRELGATALVNTGAAGSTSPELGMLDVAISSEVAFHDADTDFMKHYYPHCESFAADPGLIALAQRSIDALPSRGFAYKIGRIATGDVFVNDPALKADIIARLRPLCVEMEGAAVGQVAHMGGVPFLVIRSVSDDAGQGADVSFEDFLERAAHNSAAIVLGMIESAW